MVKNTIWGQKKEDFTISDVFCHAPTLNSCSSAPIGRNDPDPFSTALATSNVFEIRQKVEVRVFVAGAVEKGPGSFRPMGAELRLFKVGVSHFVVLDVMQS